MNQMISFLSLLRILDMEDKKCALKNRIRKNYQHLRKWAERTQTNCFRIYDRDIKEHPIAIDFYGGKFCVHYFSFARSQPIEDYMEKIDQILLSLFGCRPEDIYWRFRIKRKKMQQYEKVEEAQKYLTVVEYGVKFAVNLTDYLDTGLFLDHRQTRKMVASLADGKRVLNLFAYTCTFSVHAATAGASFTKSVDLSNTYTTWGEHNFSLNGLTLQSNEIVRADCMKFLDHEVSLGVQYDLIIIDPPTISRSKKMEHMFDVQRDYVFLLQQALKLLSEGGMLFFSTNLRTFVLDYSLFPLCNIADITKQTIPIDFHNQKIHYCWKFTFA